MGSTRRKVLVGGAALLGGGAAAALGVERRLQASSARPIRVARIDAVPQADGPALDFLVTGDTGSKTEDRDRVVDAMQRFAEHARPSFVLLVGDNFYPSGVESVDDPGWKQHFDEPFGALSAKLPFYPCLGNHDHEGNVEAQVAYSARNPNWRMAARYYAFQFPLAADLGAEFFVLDTMPIGTGVFGSIYDPQVAWLKRALAASPARWKIVMGHHPLRGGSHESPGFRLLWNLGPVFADESIDLYFSGHNHVLGLVDSGKGWVQILSGAGALPKIDTSPEGSHLWHVGPGFTAVSLRSDGAYVQFETPDKTLACFCIDRPTA